LKFRAPTHGREHQHNGADQVAGPWVDVETVDDPDSPGDPTYQFQGGWANVGDPYPPLQYRKGATGLEWQGRIDGGADGSVVCQVLADHLPFANKSFFMDIGPDGTPTQARWHIDATSGEVTVTAITAGSSGDYRAWSQNVMTPGSNGFKKYPGGARVLRARDYNVLGSDINSTAFPLLASGFTRYVVNTDLGPSGCNSAPVVFTVAFDDMDYDDATIEAFAAAGGVVDIWLRARCTTAGIDASKIYMCAKSAISTSGAKAFSPLVGDFDNTDTRMGLYGQVSVGSTPNNWGPGQSIDIKLWRDGEADATIEIDLIYLFPRDGTITDKYLSGSVVASVEFVPGDGFAGGTATQPTDDGYRTTMVDLVRDTQAVKHLLDGTIEWSAYDCTPGFVDNLNTDAEYRRIENPVHFYLAGRPDGDLGEAALVTLGSNTMPIATMYMPPGWAFYYMAMADNLNSSFEVALWVPTGSEPFPYDDPADAAIAGTGYMLSSLMDFATVGRGGG
jgi:hypothetical protein